MHRKRRRHRKRGEWKRLIREQSQSGLSQRGYCEQHGISLSAFCNAKSRVGTAEFVYGAGSAFLGVVVEEPHEKGTSHGILAMMEARLCRIRCERRLWPRPARV